MISSYHLASDDAGLPLRSVRREKYVVHALHEKILLDHTQVPLAILPADESSRRRAVDKEEGPDGFHDSELGDVYDLYNACNGVMRNGMLDVRELNELSPEEMESIDVARLREVWYHTATGCPICNNIIRTLNTIRGVLHSGGGESYRE